MKKLIVIFLIIISNCVFLKANDTNFVLLEVSTGTWCQWCPCGHQIAQQIYQTYPYITLIEYHGPAGGTDPFANFNGNDILAQLFVTSGYPSGVVGRTSGIIDRSAWSSQVTSQVAINPGARITWSKTYNSTTRQLDVVVNCTALENLTGDYYLNFVMMENNIIYAQSGNGSCAGSPTYVHNHLLRDMINGSLGDALNTGSVWDLNVTISKTLSYTVNNSWVAENCEFACFIYKQVLPLATAGRILQSKKQILTQNTLGIQNTGINASSYNLKQNYPNPFNPTTNIYFSIPKRAGVTFKIFDVQGKLVSNILENANLEAGSYHIDFDGNNLSSGVFFYTLQTKEFTETKRMLLIK